MSASAADEPQNVREMWELASVVHFFQYYRDVLDIELFHVEQLEEAVTDLDYEWHGRHLLSELFIKLMTNYPGVENRHLGRESYPQQLRNVVKQRWETIFVDDPWPENQSYGELDPSTRLLLLKAMLDWRVEIDDGIRDVVRNDPLRPEPVGEDDKGDQYWYFDDNRLYRERVESDIEPDWEVVCGTEEEWEAFLKRGSKRANSSDRALREDIRDEGIFESAIEYMHKKRKIEERRLYAIMNPPRRSSRVAQKEEELREQQRIQEELERAEEQRRKEEARQRRAEARERKLEERRMRALLREPTVAPSRSRGRKRGPPAAEPEPVPEPVPRIQEPARPMTLPSMHVPPSSQPLPSMRNVFKIKVPGSLVKALVGKAVGGSGGGAPPSGEVLQVPPAPSMPMLQVPRIPQTPTSTPNFGPILAAGRVLEGLEDKERLP